MIYKIFCRFRNRMKKSVRLFMWLLIHFLRLYQNLFLK